MTASAKKSQNLNKATKHGTFPCSTRSSRGSSEPTGPSIRSRTRAPYKNRADFLRQIPRTPEKSIEITKETCHYAWETFGTFPAVVPPMVLLYYIQARHSELEFYDQYYPAGAYLKTHKQHMEWHKKAGAARRAAGVAMSDQREA